ncbi:MAG: hypothetical protein ACK4F9_01835 [Brevinematia bacterium]
MGNDILNTLNIKFMNDEEISETVLRKLINKEKFLFIFLNIEIFYKILTDKEFKNSLKDFTIIVSSKFVGFIISKLEHLRNYHITKESSCIFRILKSISDYHYRIFVIEKSSKVVSRFKKNIYSSINSSSLNIIGTYNTWNKKNRMQKIETLKKMEPDITIVGSDITKFIKIFKKDEKLLKNFSFIFSNSGLKVISGVSRNSLTRSVKTFFEAVIIFFWFLLQKISEIRRKLW